MVGTTALFLLRSLPLRNHFINCGLEPLFRQHVGVRTTQLNGEPCKGALHIFRMLLKMSSQLGSQLAVGRLGDRILYSLRLQEVR